MTGTEISVRREPSPGAAPIEIVERKGIGHPDTLADALAERMSVAYSQHCRDRFGAVLHHNLDKLYLRGGHSRIGLGGCGGFVRHCLLASSDTAGHVSVPRMLVCVDTASAPDECQVVRCFVAWARR